VKKEREIPIRSKAALFPLRAYGERGFIFSFYNFVRVHKSLRVSPAMAAGVTDRLWTMEDIVNLIDKKSN